MWKKARPGREQTQTRPDRPFDREQAGEGGGVRLGILGAAQWNSGEDGWRSTLYRGLRFLFHSSLVVVFLRRSPGLSHDCWYRQGV